MLKQFSSKASKCYYTPNVGVLNSFLLEISKFKILDEKEIRKLVKLSKKGDEKATDKIVKSYQLFIVSVAKRYSSGNYELLCDLINEANIGLLKAIETFDLNYGTKLITHSIAWIQKSIFEYLSSTADPIKRTNKNKTIDVIKISNKFLLENGRLPAISEILDILEETKGIVVIEEADIYNIEISSMSNIVEFEGSNDMGSEIEFNNSDKMSTANEYEPQMECEYFKTIIDGAIGILTPKEQKVVKLLYGIDEFKQFELQEVAEVIGVTSEAIRLINKRALNKLKEEINIQRERI